MFRRLTVGLTGLSHKALNSIQCLIGNPLWVMCNTVFFIVWMLLQLVLKHPIDPPTMFYPGTVWLMTVIGYLIELAMKAQNQMIFEIQQKQMEAQSEQMSRIEEVLTEIKNMAKDEIKRDSVVKEIIVALDHTVDKVAEALGGDKK